MNIPYCFECKVWVFPGRERQFDSMCNKTSVDLESLELDEDCQFIQDLLKEFHEKTGSQRALQILQNWAQEKQFFVKVRSKDRIEGQGLECR